MKTQKSRVIIILFSCIYLYGYTQEIKVLSKVESATLYLNGAFVKREAKIELKRGKSILIFTDIPETSDIKSIQLSAGDNVRIISVKPTLSSIKINIQTSLIKKMEDSIIKTQTMININELKLKVLSEEESILRKNQPSFTDKFIIDPLKLKEVLDFNNLKLTDIYITSLTLKDQQREYQSIKKEIVKRLNAEKTKEYEKQISLEVEIESSMSSFTKFEITYFTMFASWKPSYDIRVLDVSKPIDLTMNGAIIQNTGEDWKDINLSVSNGQPSGTESYPSIKPWYLGYNQYQNNANNLLPQNPNVKYISGVVTDSDGYPLIGANIVLKEFMEIGTVTDIDGKYYLPVLLGAKNVVVSYTGYETEEVAIHNENMNFELSEGKLLDEIVVTGAGRNNTSTGSIVNKDKILKDFNTLPVTIKYQPTTFSYEMKEVLTINNSTTPIQLEILLFQIPAVYSYYTVPKYDKSVFLTAGILGWQDYNLLDGNINLYLEGKYLGQSVLNTKIAEDTLLISLGRDQSVIVERTKIKEYTKKSYLSGNRTEIRAYALTLKNNKNQTIKITLQDHVPISTDKSIEVFDIDAKSGFVQPGSHIVTWELELEPKSEKISELRYTVKYPSGKRLELD